MSTSDSQVHAFQCETVNAGPDDGLRLSTYEHLDGEHGPHEQLALSRRSLLGAAGALTLAASGLLLPSWLEEAEAREGALEGDKGGRRGKNRRGRGRKRTHGDGKDDNEGKDKPRGRDFFEMRNMAIAVHNYRSAPVRVRGWQPRDYAGRPWVVPGGWDWKELPARSGTQHYGTEFVGTRKTIAIQIGDNRVVFGQNHIAPTLPSAAIRTGSWNDQGQVGGQDIKEGTLWVGSSFFSGDIRVTRVDDTEDHILYSVDLT